MNDVKSAQQPQLLFVDDEENILKSITRLLIDEPFDVHTATSGQEALNLLDRNRSFAVIVSDQRMPGMSGAEFLEKAKKLVPDAVRIVLTGYADVTAAVDAINKGGAFRYIAKPWNDEELVNVLREAASRYTLLQENKRLTEIVHRQNAELQQWNTQLQYFVQQQTVEISKKNDELNRFNDRLRKNFSDVIQSFAGLLELRDKLSMSHSRNVSEVSARAAQDMRLPSEDIENITIASLLHDIGEIGIADVLLVKRPETMSTEELKDYMLHPVRGQAAIDGIEDLRKAGVLIRYHHEAYDGTGFPDKLKGDQIPLGSRIIAVADLFDRTFAQLHDKKAVELAWNSVKQEAGKKLDPAICGLLEKPLREKYATVAPKAGIREVELLLKDLAAGMVVSRDVLSGTGILLLSKGTLLDQKNIQALRRYEQVDPTQRGVFIWAMR